MTNLMMEQNKREVDGKESTTTANPAEMPDSVASDLVELFKLLSDETRLRVLFALWQSKEMHVRALCELLDQSQPAVSHHLALLRVAGLIERRRDGKHNFYYLVPRRMQNLLDLVFSHVMQGETEIRIPGYLLQSLDEG